MEFWGVEVQSGKPLNVQPGDGMVIHLSQASVGEVKGNKNEPITLFVKVDDKKLVLGTLFSDKLPQQLFDLVFDRDFELSHNSKSGPICFFGYRAANPIEEEEGFDSDDSEDEDIPLMLDNGKPDINSKAGKPVVAAKASKDSAAGKQKVKIVEPTKDEDDDDSEDGDSDEDGSSDGNLMDEDDSDSEDEDSDEEDDTPKKEAPSKKRAAESATKTPVSQKKAKLATPQKTDGKKSSGHVATPYPSKQAGKTPANKSAQQSPKSGGTHSCGPCKKTFNSEVGLQSHTKAKHSAGK